jgi:hypothetical protein
MEMNKGMNISDWGFCERDKAIKLLQALQETEGEGVGSGLTLCFNPNSGFVFLSNDDLDTYMLNNGKLEQWHYCPDCGKEGFKEEFEKTDACISCASIANR